MTEDFRNVAIRTAGSFRIVPPDTPATPEWTDLILETGAFGSGEHETTASCLEAISGLDNLSGTQVLDFGSGTGVLALAALKLGAAHALCIDIDPGAVETSRKNFNRNCFASQGTHRTDPLSDDLQGQFSLILANIYGDILLREAQSLVASAAPGATLILSGILWEYNYDVRTCYEALGCMVVKNRMLEEFSTVVMRKK